MPALSAISFGRVVAVLQGDPDHLDAVLIGRGALLDCRRTLVAHRAGHLGHRPRPSGPAPTDSIGLAPVAGSCAVGWLEQPVTTATITVSATTSPTRTILPAPLLCIAATTFPRMSAPEYVTDCNELRYVHTAVELNAKCTCSGIRIDDHRNVGSARRDRASTVGVASQVSRSRSRRVRSSARGTRRRARNDLACRFARDRRGAWRAASEGAHHIDVRARACDEPSLRGHVRSDDRHLRGEERSR